MITHRNRFLEIVRKPPDSEAGNLAARFAVIPSRRNEIESYALSQDYFRFMFAGVEPTNNLRRFAC